MVVYRTGVDCIDWGMLFELYSQVGLVAGLGKKKDYKKIESAFRNCSKVVTAWKNNLLLGAGRLFTDGITYGVIFDVGVLPEYHNQGIGRGIMKELLKNTESLYIYLTSTFGNEEFYRKLGFKRHKNAFAKYPHESEYLED